MRHYFISSKKRKFTCMVTTDDAGYIERDGTAPILKKFIGQHLSILLLWAGDNILEKIL